MHWALLLAPLVILCLLSWLMFQSQQQLISSLQSEKQDLLNRLVSKDLQTYSVMSNLKHPAPMTSEYIPQSDEAELLRWQQYAPIGETLMVDDPDGDGAMEDLGFYRGDKE